MRLSDVAKLISDGGIHCVCWNIPDEPLPFATVVKPKNGETVYADNGMYYTSMRVELYLAMHKDDEDTEYKVNSILENAGINYTYEMYFTEKENCNIKVYTFEVKED